MKYTEKIVLGVGITDKKGNMHPSEMLDIFQNVATAHAEKLGVGFAKMIEKNLLWVVTQIKYQVCGEIKEGQEVVVITWPSAPSRAGFERDYLVCDEGGNTLIKGVSNWVLMDANERTLSHLVDVYPSDEYCTDKNFEQRTRRLRDFEAEGKGYDVTPKESAIDRNGHVNNAKYADFVEEALGGFDGVIDIFQIDFIHEVMPGMRLKLYCESEENSVRIKGSSEEGNRMFGCSVIYK